MAQRHRDARHAQAGACNSLALANSLAEAIKAARVEHGGSFTPADRDPAVRLIAHQIAHLLNLPELDQCREYTAAVDACEARESEPVRATWQAHERARAGDGS